MNKELLTKLYWEANLSLPKIARMLDTYTCKIWRLMLKEYEYTLHIDWDYDWPKHWIDTWQDASRQILASFGIRVEKIIMKPGPSKQGQHVWIHIRCEVELTDDNINMLQWLCLDHHTRTWINILRTDRGLKKWWSKLFSRHLWKKPLPKRCQKCKLREILNQMREAYELQAAEKQNS